MSTPPIPIRLSEKEPVVDHGVPAADREPEKALSVSPSLVRHAFSPADINLIALNDKCYQRLRTKEKELMNRPIPTRTAVAAAWRAVLKAYSAWAELKHAPLRNLKELEDIRTEMRKRKVTLAQIATRNMVFKVQFRLGPKFHERREPRVGTTPTKTSPPQSTPPTETITSPPKPSDAPSKVFEHA
jgi:hypothetical protein